MRIERSLLLAFGVAVGCGAVRDPGPMRDERDARGEPPMAEDSGAPPIFVSDAAPGIVGGDASVLVVDTDHGAKNLAPVAPVAGGFMWPSLQTQLRWVNSTSTCTGRVTLAVSDHAVCYTAADDTMKCAGSTYGTEYGSSFVAAGQTGVDQIILSDTQGDLDANNVCIHRVDKKVFCFGGYNASDVFATGDSSPRAAWTPWNGGKTFEHIAGDAASSMCAIDDAGTITCNPSQLSPAGGPFDRISFGATGISGSDTTILRSASCDVTTSGIHCHAPADPGMVPAFPATGIVDAGFFLGGPGGPYRECVLDEAGLVTCAGLENGAMKYARAFTRGGGIVAFAMSRHSRAMCAVSETGALWCVGSNARGELGAGTTLELPLPVEVQPPGSVHIGCP